MTCNIVPAVIPKTLAHLSEALTLVRGAASDVQIDVVDGVFVSNKSWPYVGAKIDGDAFRRAVPAGFLYEFDLMVADVPAILPEFLALNPARVVLHVESFARTEACTTALQEIRSSGAHAVLAVNNDTPLAALTAHADDIDGVQCMGIAQLGDQGNTFDKRVLPRIATLRKQYPRIPISIDGSVNEETLPLLYAAGADRFVAGSAIFGAHDPRTSYDQLCEQLAHL